MLIGMNTLTPVDFEVWRGYGRYDQAIGSYMDQLERKAIREIRQFHNQHPNCVTNVSWGKDSVVVAHLTWMADPTIPIVWVPAVRKDGTCYETAPSFQVRDTFLDTHSGCIYSERPGHPKNPRRGEPGWEDYMQHVKERHQNMLGEQVKEPHITGVRADESAMRRMSIRSRGLSSTHTCRPIGRWSAEQVFAYLETRELPVHGAYAASYGGDLDRRWLRVHAIRSIVSTSATHYKDIARWEDDYFPSLCSYRPRKEHN